jgi:hypothetical protein
LLADGPFAGLTIPMSDGRRPQSQRTVTEYRVPSTQY